MFDLLPAISAEIRVPRIAWRGDTGFQHEAETTAADVLRHEQERGLMLDAGAAFVAFLAGFHASALLWVTFKRSHTARYGPPVRVKIDAPAYVIGQDNHGGFLLFFADDLTMPRSEDITMTDIGLATIGGYAVLERRTDAPDPDEIKLAGLYQDRSDAVNHARIYPATGDRAKEDGLDAWAEVHPVTQGFYDTFTSDKTEGDRLTSLAGFYSYAKETDGGLLIPAAADEPDTARSVAPPKEAEPMDLDDKRRADLGNRIDYLQATAESIITERDGSAAGHYQAHREVFDTTQGELAEKIEQAAPADRQGLATEKEAQGHEYAGFLASRIGDHHDANNQPDLADGFHQEAEARTDIAAKLREGQQPERPTDPTPPAAPENSAAETKLFTVPAPDNERRSPPLPAQEAVDLLASYSNYTIAEQDSPQRDLREMGGDKVGLYAEDGGFIASGLDYPDLAERLAADGYISAYQRDPTPPGPTNDNQATGHVIDHAPGSRYDALRASEAEASALLQQRELAANKGEVAPGDTTPTTAARIEPEDEKKKAASAANTDGVDFSGINKATFAESRNAFEIDVGIGPGGMTTNITNRTHQNLEKSFDSEQPLPMHPNDRRALEAATASSPDAQAARLAFQAELATVADSRDVNGFAPAEREIMTRQNAESSQRQENERRAEAGEAPDASATAAAPMSYLDKIAARAAAYQAERETAASDPANAQEAAPTVSFGR